MTKINGCRIDQEKRGDLLKISDIDASKQARSHAGALPSQGTHTVSPPDGASILGSHEEVGASALSGLSPTVIETRRRIRKFSTLAAPVLVSGESGTGKSLVAQCLHRTCFGAADPFVVLNGSELAGIRKISKTGSVVGCAKLSVLIDTASGGSLVIEQVEDLPEVLQAELAQILGSGEHHWLRGQARTRLIVETRCDLGAEAAGGRVREELYARISGLRIHMSPLRARPEDIAAIAKEELAILSTDREYRLDDEAYLRLSSHHWPGNIRELLSVVRHAVRLAGPQDTIDRLDIDEALRHMRIYFSPRGQYEEAERTRLRAALDASSWNVTATARALGVTRSWLRRRLKSLELA